MKKLMKFFLISLLFVVFISSNLIAQHLKKGEISKKPYRTSTKKLPDWVKDDKTYFEEKGEEKGEEKDKAGKIKIKMIASAESKDGNVDLNWLQSVLDAYAVKNYITSIKTIATRELGDAISGGIGSVKKGEYCQDIINAVAKNISFSSLFRTNLYWAIYKKMDSEGNLGYNYEIYGMYSLEKSAYKEAKKKAWEDVVPKITSEDNDAKKILDDAKKKFLDENK